MTMRRVGRLQGFCYTGAHRYSLTFCTHERRQWFRDDGIVRACWEEFLRASQRHAIAVFTCVFMPDHAHMMVEGRASGSHLPAFAALAKQYSGYRVRAVTLPRLWQDGYYDHVLRNDESTRRTVRYILENPVRAGLSQTIEGYPFFYSSEFDRGSLIEWAYQESD